MKHLSIKVFGRVQGVFFRDAARLEANRLGINGFARNEPNGTVSIEAEGDPANLEDFLKWCHKGSTWSRVEKVDVTEGELRNYSSFAVRF